MYHTTHSNDNTEPCPDISTYSTVITSKGFSVPFQNPATKSEWVITSINLRWRLSWMCFCATATLSQLYLQSLHWNCALGFLADFWKTNNAIIIYKTNKKPVGSHSTSGRKQVTLILHSCCKNLTLHHCAAMLRQSRKKITDTLPLTNKTSIPTVLFTGV